MNIYPRSGHVYLDLVEKEQGTTRAQMRGVIWANDFPAIRDKFELVTKEPFREGLKILFLARINLHSTYGLSLWISEVEPGFTLGELSRLKSRTIERLMEEGVFDLNKELPIPAIPLRIAVISAETSKGYLDFIQVIKQHQIPYRFEITLFPALLQGDKAVESIRKQLKIISSGFTGLDRSRIPDPGSRIRDPQSLSTSARDQASVVRHMASDFDLVAIIRGGGDEIGMTCFDDYELAREVCTFPLPVSTGIGHSTNETVVEMVAALNRITPTEVAYDLLARMDDAYERLMDAEASLWECSAGLISESQKRLADHAENLLSITKSFIRRQQRDMEHQETTFRLFANHFFISHKARLSLLEGEVKHLDPKQILQRGYSMTFDRHGNVLKDPSRVSPGDKIMTELAQGTIKSTIDP